MTTLPLNHPGPDTPMFNALLGERDPQAGPLFDLWDPDFVPSFAQLPQLLSEAEEAVAVFERAAIRSSEWFHEHLAGIEALHHQICSDLKLASPAPVEPEEMAFLTRVLTGLERLGGHETETVVIEPVLEPMTEHREVVAATLVPSRNVMRDSCPTCFPRPCDLESPRSECRRTASPVQEQPAIPFTPGEELREMLNALHDVSAGIDPATTRAEVTITTVPPEVIDRLAAEQAVAAQTRFVDYSETLLAPQDAPPAITDPTGFNQALTEQAGQATVYAVHSSQMMWHDEIQPCTRSGLCVEGCVVCTGRIDCQAVIHTHGCFADTLDVGRLCDDRPHNAEREGMKALTNRALTDLLSLVEVQVTEETVAGWTDEQRDAAEEWAGLTHLDASDNDVEVPPRPEFLEEFLVSARKVDSIPEVSVGQNTVGLEMWFCPEKGHKDVDWDDDGVAWCMEVGCDKNSTSSRGA